MRIRSWLMTGTSLGLMAFAPITVQAQDDAVVAAYQAYTAAQASGDAAALETAQAAFTEQCIVSGYASIDECIAAITAAAAAPAPAPEAAPAEAPAPEAAPAEAPAPEAVAPAAEPAPAPEAAPAEAPAPEAVAPAAEPAPAPEPAPAEVAPEPAPAPEAVAAPEAAPAEAPAPEPAPVEPAAEAAPTAEPAPAEQPAAEAPAAEAPAPAPEAAAPVAAPTVDISADLQAQIDIYNGAIADMMAGGDAAAAQAQIADAQANIAALCTKAGYGDTTSCLAAYGMELPAVPGMPAEQPAAEQPAAEAPATDAAVVAQPTEVIETLPQGITQDQVAPVLDSAKDVQADPAAQTQMEATVAAEPVAPPPETDAAAQSPEMRAFAAEAPVPLEQGTEVTAVDNTTVTQTVNNTYINNITNITNTTTNNTTNNTQNNIGQQNNVTVVEQAPVQAADTGDIITQVILQVGSQLIVNSVGQDTDRFYNQDEDEIFYENLSNGRTREVITHPDGSQIITVRNRNGDVLRRSRIDPAGREYILANFDDRYDDDLVNWRDPGQDLPPLRLNIPVQDYVLDAEDADQDAVEVFFRQPPVEQVARLYSIDEVKRSARVRDSVRKLEVGGLTFDTGAATISRDQVGALSKVAEAMLALLEQNPAETFLIEGHTDAVGSDISNLQLSDLRAATVARILTDFYHVPPENLATQGYGERYLRIRTELAERENRRVTIRRITPLITLANN